MDFYVYILQSEQDGSYYFGFTSDLERRLYEHNNGMSTYTKRKIPWRVVYFEIKASKKEAIIRERTLKKIKNKSVYQQMIIDFNKQ